MMGNTSKISKLKNSWWLIVWMLFGGIIGYIFASGAITVPDDANFSFSLIYEYDLMFGVLALIVLVLLIWNVIGLIRLNAMNDEDQHSDELISPKEKLLATIIKVSAYNTIFTLLWLMLAFAHALGPDSPREDMQTYMLVNMISGCITVCMAIILQQRTLMIYNKTYPDRSLNLKSKSMNEANREMFAKMDEGEQWTVYKSAYSAFKITNVTLIAGIMLFTLYSLLFGFTPLPIIVLGIILLVQQTVYYHEVGKSYK